MIEYIGLFFRETAALFLEMAPYLLLGLTVAGMLSVIMSKSFVARHAGKPGLGAVIKAALLGVPLPLCSCGVVPTAAYLKNAGASRPAVISFLVSTPQTGVDSILATYGMLGPLFAIFRPLAALITGVAGGIASIFIPADGKNVETSPIEAGVREENGERNGERRGFLDSVKAAARYGYGEALDDIVVHFIVGLAIAGVISLVIPDDYFVGTFLGEGFAAMVLMVVVGVPMYVCSTSSIPIAVALIAKGISPGAAYVFLVAGPATNAATLAVLLRVLGRRHTILYVATIVLGSLAFGPIMNGVTTRLGWTMPAMDGMALHGASVGILTWVASGVLLILMVLSLLRRWMPDRSVSNLDEERRDEERTDAPAGVSITRLSVQGMSCHHCAANVESAISSIEGVEGVTVDLNGGSASVAGAVDVEAVRRAIVSAGYEVGD